MFIHSRDVLFAGEDFHDYANVKCAGATSFYPDNWQFESADEENKLEPEPPINQPVGETFEDRFMYEVQQLGPYRDRRAPRRFDKECNIVSLTSDID